VTHSIELLIDVDCPDLQTYAQVAATLVFPALDGLSLPPVVCFAKPAGSYSRAYFTCDLPGPGSGAQAQWHAEQGWIFVAVDIVGTGDSSRHPTQDLTLPVVSEVSARAEEEILLRLANGMIAPDLPPIIQPTRIGIGHSLGGCLTIMQQAHHASYDGIVVLGYGVFHNHPPSPPGEPPVVVPWFSRDVSVERPGGILNRAAVEAHRRRNAGSTSHPGLSALQWSSYYDDVPDDVIGTDLSHYEYAPGSEPDSSMPGLPWAASGFAGHAAQAVLTPGLVLSEAAAVTVPVLTATGERDFIAEPLGEPRAFRSAYSVDLFVCPRMGHMHNFASTRQLLWRRIEAFGGWCEALR
jgi:pimeloyl-ACP methyl ester carboxylesterase